MAVEPAIVPILTESPSPMVLKNITAVLARGGLVGLPTDTLYGLTANIDYPEALARLRVIKGLPADSPLLFLVNSPEMAEEYWTTPLPEQLKRLITALWPGPLTVIYKTHLGNPNIATNGTLALRMPASSFLLDLVEMAGVPLASTSANSHGNPPAGCPREAMGIFPREIDLWVDGGQIKPGEPSTVFDAINECIIRQGRIKPSELWDVWQEKRV